MSYIGGGCSIIYPPSRQVVIVDYTYFIEGYRISQHVTGYLSEEHSFISALRAIEEV